ncbi:MAG: cyclic nucleotide-binding domain-containing protein [Desulfovibrionaceae bacterium]
MAQFQCPSCGTAKTVPDRYAGKKAKCPECGAVVEISATAAPVEASVPDAAELLAAVAAEPGPRRDEGPAPTVDDLSLDDLVADDAPEAGPGPELEVQPDLAAPAAPRPDHVHLLQGNPGLNLASGVVSGLLGAFFCVALAVLLLPQGTASGVFPHVLSVVLGSAALACLVYALGSRIPFALAGPEISAFAVLFVILGSLRADMAGRYPDDVIDATLWAAVSGSALVSAVAALALAKVRGGGWVRFMPIQIVGGVLAALGLILFQAAYLFLTGEPLTLSGLLDACNPDAIQAAVTGGSIWRWLPAFALGWLLFAVFRRSRRNLFLLLALAAVSALGWFVPSLGLPRVTAVLDQGPRLFYQFDPKFYADFYGLDFLGLVRWDVLQESLVLLASLAVLVVVTSLQMANGMGGAVGRVLDLDREIRVTGWANLLCGLAGGTPVALSYGRSLGARSCGASGPLAGLAAALVTGAAVVFVGYVLPYIPAFVPAGLLVFVGLTLLKTWLVDTRSEFTRRDDYALLLLTFAVTAFLGVVPGIGLGVVLAMLVTVSRYSRAGAVKHVLSGAHHRSHVDRAPVQIRCLKQHGDQIFIIRLQGFAFLGTLNDVLDMLRERLDDASRPPLRYAIVDFGFVTGLGSQVALGFAQLLTFGRRRGFVLVCTAVPFELEESLERNGLVEADNPEAIQLFVNLDYAMEWCENGILTEQGLMDSSGAKLPDLLGPVFPEARLIPLLMKCMQRVRVKKGEYVFHQGDPSDSMYFIEAGRLTVELNLDGGKTLRLKKMGPGAVFGEMGIYATAPRSASIRVDEAGILYRLSLKRLAFIRKKLPALYSAINRYLVTLMAERVADANALVRDLSR